jgi:hypothetical protein
MTSDLRDKLLAAARAAGYEVLEHGGIIYREGEFGEAEVWQPTIDRLQAHDLAFDCGMIISYAEGLILEDKGYLEIQYSFTPGDKQSFCTAVVEAAAEMGRMNL